MIVIVTVLGLLNLFFNILLLPDLKVTVKTEDLPKSIINALLNEDRKKCPFIPFESFPDEINIVFDKFIKDEIFLNIKYDDYTTSYITLRKAGIEYEWINEREIHLGIEKYPSLDTEGEFSYEDIRFIYELRGDKNKYDKINCKIITEKGVFIVRYYGYDWNIRNNLRFSHYLDFETAKTIIENWKKKREQILL